MSHLVAVFSYVDTTRAGIHALKQRGVRDFTLHMPTYLKDLADEVDDRPSPVRWVVLIGAIAGFVGAVAMQGWMSLDWPLRTSMKPVLSWPAYTIIMFECTVLIGGLSNLVALFGFARLPSPNLGPGYDRRFTDDKFGLVVPAAAGDVESLKQLLAEAGAEEITHVAA